MKNLWRILAVAWLGGVASPVLADEPPDLDSPPAAVSGEHTASRLDAHDGAAGQSAADASDRSSRNPRG
ncbi:MAG TPA: hypothetical protein VE397_08545 [Stellaceae bacterium]|nr:hypothetical protein [Stellaceae bacterium]